MNVTMLIGRLTKDPELRMTSGGHAVTSFTVAVNRDYAKEGEQQADFIQCQAWRKTAEAIANNLHKGSRIGIEGRIQTRSYDNQQGQRVYITEVVANRVEFLDSKPQQGQGQAQGYQQGNQPPQGYNASQGFQAPYADMGHPIDISEDDLPF